MQDAFWRNVTLPALHTLRHFAPARVQRGGPLGPLLERQSYVKQVPPCEGGLDCRAWHRLPPPARRNEADAVAAAFGAPAVSGPWLDCADPRPVAAVVLHRAGGPTEGRLWRAAMKAYPNCVFLGGQAEWYDFVTRFGPVCHFQGDLWEQARILKAAHLAVCDQGDLYWLAAGLGVPTLLEVDRGHDWCRLPWVTCWDPLSGDPLALPDRPPDSVGQSDHQFTPLDRPAKITCLLSSHDKPDYCREAVESVLLQEYQNWELIVMDSGVLHERGYFRKWPDRRVKVYTTGEGDSTRKARAMAPWSYNECRRRGLITGDLVTYLCDDDVLYPCAFRLFADLARSTDGAAWYASVDLAYYEAGGRPEVYKTLKPDGVGGVGGRRLDCQADYLQLCHRADLLGRVWWPEGLDTARHADGVFMDLLGSLTPVHPSDVKVGQNRRTPLSTYTPWRGRPAITS